MWLNLLIKIKKTLRASQSNSRKNERQTPLTIDEDTDTPSSRQMLNEVDRTPDIQRETDTEDDWLNKGIPEPYADAIKKEDDDWLNAGLAEVTANVPAQQDNDWLNTENNRPPQVLDRKGEGPYDPEIAAVDSSPSFQSLEDIITVKLAEEPANPSHGLMDEVSVRPTESPVLLIPQPIDEIPIRSVENQVTASPGLMDEISVRPAESPVLLISQPIDEISIRPVENQVTASPGLMDEISVRPAESPVLLISQPIDEISIRSVENQVTASPGLMDEVSIRTVENQVTESHGLMDEISTRPVESPVNIEYELLDDLITKSAIYRTKKAEPSSDEVITNVVENPVERTGPVKTIRGNEISGIQDKKRDFRHARPSISPGLRSTPLPTRKGKETGNLLSQAKNLYKKAELSRSVTKALAALRIFNNNEFYIQDTDLTLADASAQQPQIKDFTFRVLNTASELDELIDSGYDLVMNCNKIKRGLKKGMVAFLIFAGKELASIGWACVTEESKETFGSYPYNDDLDRQVCIVGDWTNPKFRDSNISSYVKQQRQQLLREKGFTFERSMVKDLRSMRAPERFELTYKRRTYVNVSLPGILGVEFWQEHPLNGTNSKPLYHMFTLSFLVLPSPPKVTDMNTLSLTGPYFSSRLRVPWHRRGNGRHAD